MNDYAGDIIIRAGIDTKEFDSQIKYVEAQLEEIEYQLKRADMGFEVGDTLKLEKEYEVLINKLIDLKQKKEKVSNQPLDDGITNKNFSKGLDGIITKLKRIGFLVLGARTAYSLFKQSFDRVKEGHPELEKALNHIKGSMDVIVDRIVTKLIPYLPKILQLTDMVLNIVLEIGDALGTVLWPMIQYIIEDTINGINKIITLINNTENSLFGSVGGMWNLWHVGDDNGLSSEAEKFAASMNKASKATKSSTKEVAKLRKQLMGFDEMNVLNDSGGTSALGGGGGAGAIATIIKGEQEAKKLQDDLLVAVGVFSRETLGLRDKFREKGFKETFTELLMGKKEENERKVNEIKPVIMDFLNGTATTRQQAVAEFTKAPWINAFFGSNSDIDNKKTKILDANSIIGTSMDGVASKSKTDANTTKTSWFTAATDISKKYTDKTQNGLVGSVTGALDSITTTSEKDTKAALEKIKTLINNFKPSPKTLTIKADTTNFDKAVKKVKDFLNGKGVYNVTINGNSTGGGRYGAKGLIIPKLASGGIINRPGRGIPLAGGGAIAGERGREAVLPLTDSLQMQRLGEEIAKNIVVNLTNEVRLDGKQLSRYISRVMQDTQFSSNGGVI